MSLLDPTDVDERLHTGLDEEVLQAIIDGEEAWLASKIGPLEGERTEVFHDVRPGDTLYLQRPTDEATVTDGESTVLDTEMRANGWRVLRTGSYWSGLPISVDYEPNDLALVTRGLYRLISLAVTVESRTPGILQETIGSYSYTLAGAGDTSPSGIRAEVLRSLRPPRTASTVRVHGTVLPLPQGRSPVRREPFIVTP